MTPQAKERAAWKRFVTSMQKEHNTECAKTPEGIFAELKAFGAKRVKRIKQRKGGL